MLWNFWRSSSIVLLFCGHFAACIVATVVQLLSLTGRTRSSTTERSLISVIVRPAPRQPQPFWVFAFVSFCSRRTDNGVGLFSLEWSQFRVIRRRCVQWEEINLNSLKSNQIFRNHTGRSYRNNLRNCVQSKTTIDHG